MNFSRLTINAKLAAINLLLTAALLAIVSVAWHQLPTYDEAAELARLGQAQHAAQNADMLHDALNSDVLSALLAGDEPEAFKERIRQTVRSDAQEFRDELATLKGMTLDSTLEKQLEQARTVGLAYAEAAETMVQRALVDASRAAAERKAFGDLFETAKVALAAQTSRIAGSMKAANDEARQAAQSARRWLFVAALATVLLGWLGVGLIGRSIRRSLVELRDVAKAVAAGNLGARSARKGHDEVGALAGSLDQMADALETMIDRMRDDAERRDFASKLVTALDMADSERQAQVVVERAMARIAPDRPMELLLADSSEAHLERAAKHPIAGAPGCGVDSPFACIAVRRGHAVSFPDSEALDACPKLRGRPIGAVSATCVPVAFMGRALGVVHASGPVGEPLGDMATEQLVTLGTQAGARIGTVRAFERTQVQASTDALTGLPNRRSAESLLRTLGNRREPFAFVMADLDHFKLLNDTHGHQAGDEALRAFADAARSCMRQHDMACRWGGEEFAFILVGSDADAALQWATRLRDALADALRRRSVPKFTASFGIADSTLGLPLESVIAAADMALYRAKDRGRDGSVVSTEQDLEALTPLLRESQHCAEVDVRRLVNQV